MTRKHQLAMQWQSTRDVCEVGELVVLPVVFRIVRPLALGEWLCNVLPVIVLLASNAVSEENDDHTRSRTS